MTNAELRPIPEFPSQGTIYDRAGMPVDASGWEWLMNDVTGRNRLSWKKFPLHNWSILEASVCFIRNMIETRGPMNAKNAFEQLTMIAGKSSVLQDASENGTTIPFSLFSEMRATLGDGAWLLHHVRRWYCWAADNGFENFDADVAFEAEQMRIGGNAKGQAVLSLDPEEGPLDDLEIVALLNALRKATKEGQISLQEQAAVWLCVAFGSNPLQPALMREEDVKVIAGDGGEVQFVHVDIPRMKKGDAMRREAFRRRPVNEEIGKVLLALIDENRRRRGEEGWNPDFAFALFARVRPSLLSEGPLREYAMHLTPQEFSVLLKKAVDKLGVVSHRTSEPMNVSTRRLRYTFATRLVNEGVPKREIADLLDHTDLQHVQVYFDVRSDIVRPLDRAVALALGPIAQAFLGKLVGSERAALRGDDPSSRVAVVDDEAAVVRAVGTCGSYGFCGLMSPVACYTCGSFQPWMDGPHQLLLDRLLADRERRRAAGRDGRIVAIYDATILAIADVVARIDAAKGAAR